MPSLSFAFGRLLGACAGLAALLLLAMVVGITADIVGRNHTGVVRTVREHDHHFPPGHFGRIADGQ